MNLTATLTANTFHSTNPVPTVVQNILILEKFSLEMDSYYGKRDLGKIQFGNIQFGNG